MGLQQLILGLVLATMVFSVALELRLDDFRSMAQGPKAVVCGHLVGGRTGTGTGRNYAGPTRTLGAPGPDGDLNASAGSGMALPRPN
jgi:hypothetical protein